MFRLLLTIALGLVLMAGCSDNANDKASTASAEESAAQRQFQTKTEKLFERVATVVDGYQAFSGKLPLKLQDLDTGGYMFDSAYLAEILPEGAELYLALAADKSTTRMWLQQAGQPQIFSRSLVGPSLERLKADDLQVLKTKWQELAKVGRLTQVKL